MAKTREQIHYNMSRVKSSNSDIEQMLRKALWRHGVRYRKNVRSIYGCPDIACKKKKIAVFCDSEFWHGFDWENRKADFKSNQAFWIAKIERNIERDKEVTQALLERGWLVLRYWDSDVKKDCNACVKDIMQYMPIPKEENHDN